MNLPQSATVAGLDYEKLIDSRFVTMVIAHQRRTNRAIGINQDGYHMQGLRVLRDDLKNNELMQSWLEVLDKTADKATEIRKAFEAGEIDAQTAMAQAAILEKLTGINNG